MLGNNFWVEQTVAILAHESAAAAFPGRTPAGCSNRWRLSNPVRTSVSSAASGKSGAKCLQVTKPLAFSAREASLRLQVKRPVDRFDCKQQP